MSSHVPGHSGRVAEGQQGAALIAVLLLMTAVASLGFGLVTLGGTESAVSGRFRAANEALYAADAAVEHVALELTTMADWSDALAGRQRSAFFGASASRAIPVDPAAATAALQADMARFAPGGGAAAWRLFAWGALSGLLDLTADETPISVAVWVADDVLDGDGDAEADANGVVRVVARAFGTHGAVRTIAVDLARVTADEATGSTVVRMLSWQEVR